jgi:hypothetical protein
MAAREVRPKYSASGTENSGKRIAHREILGLTPWSLVTTGKKLMKKISTAFAVALGVAALAACNQSPQEQAADNIEANAENTADVIESNTENAADAVEANGQNAADEVRAAGENTADAVRNGADADGNSAN